MAITMNMVTFNSVSELVDYLSDVGDDAAPFGLVTHAMAEAEEPEMENMTGVEEGVPTAGVEAEEYYPPEEEEVL